VSLWGYANAVNLVCNNFDGAEVKVLHKVGFDVVFSSTSLNVLIKYLTVLFVFVVTRLVLCASLFVFVCCTTCAAGRHQPVR
jgi:hypothetical protein